MNRTREMVRRVRHAERDRKRRVLRLLRRQEIARARFYATGKHPWERQ